MNTSTEIKPSNTRPLRWRNRHKNLYFALGLAGCIVLGALPGLGAFYLLLGNAHNILRQNTHFQTMVLLLVAYGLLFVGILMGILIACALFLVEKICFPEDTGPPSEKHSAQQ